MSERTLFTKFTGGWCDNCRIASATQRCPDCGLPMRPAQIIVEPLDDEPQRKQEELIRMYDAGQQPGNRKSEWR